MHCFNWGNLVGTAGFEPDRRVSQGIRFLDFSGISTILPLAPIPGCPRVREVAPHFAPPGQDTGEAGKNPSGFGANPRILDYLDS